MFYSVVCRTGLSAIFVFKVTYITFSKKSVFVLQKILPLKSAAGDNIMITGEQDACTRDMRGVHPHVHIHHYREGDQMYPLWMMRC